LKGTVGIGTRIPDASSIFDGVSTTKGVLLPRMNTTQQNAIASPAVGLIIFNTDTADYMVYKVSSWVRIGGGSSGGGTVTGTGTTNTISKWTSSTAIGNSSLNDDGSMVSTASQLWVSKTGAVSTPGVAFTGAWYSGGSGTTTKAYLLIEPTAATSTGWSTSGTGIGINAASGFTGNLIDAQLNGVSKFSVSSAGTVTMPTPFTLGATSVTSTGTQLNYLNAATGTTGTASSNIVFSASPTLTGTATTAAITASGALTLSASAQTPASFSSSFAGNMQVNWNSTTGNNVNFVFQDAGTARWYIGNNSATGSDRLHILNSSAQEAITVLQGLQVGINQTAPTARLHLGAGVSTASYAPLKFTTGTSNTTAEAGAMEYTTPQLFFTNGRAVRQEIFQGQQARVSTQYDNTTTTLGNVTGLTANVAASGTYRFEAKLYTTSDVAGGIKVAIGGTATATAIRYEGLTTDAGLTTQSRATALGTAVGAVTAVTAAYVVITGTITVNAAGTLTVQAAANAATGTTSVLTGSTFVITEML